MKKFVILFAVLVFWGLLIKPGFVFAQGQGSDCTTSGVCDAGLVCQGVQGSGSTKICQGNTNASGEGPLNNSNCPSNSLYTAIGCIPINSTENLVGFLLKWSLGIGGGIAFLLIVYAGFLIMTASGNPERIKAGQELMTSAVAGLMLIILSTFILWFIGVKILGVLQ